MDFWWSLYGDTCFIDIDSSSIRATLNSYGHNRSPATIVSGSL